MIASVVIIALGASLGALLRWWLGLAWNAIWPALPLGTLAANLVGGLLIGIASEVLASRAAIPPEWRLAIITGFLGGLTTFSTFSLEVSTQLQQGRIASAAIEIVVHVMGSVLLTIAGIVIAQQVLRT
ncbi:fluoride efflux transporter CrcB [Herminiimonas sp. CN]|uniref:fluoride efflux transporter CrcB n=1 Tax=Herminiimonas sp. CN TaxID=1349818 RepID=UPI00047398FC|nr:fluoride efflux transporter CrcB [Herminiimonas sp. CN]